MIQLRILHLSDTHFGPHHRCGPEDHTHSMEGYPSLFELLKRDLNTETFPHPAWRQGGASPNPLIVVFSGDLTEFAKPEEFNAAHLLLSNLVSEEILGTKLTLSNVFVVPGNHDVVYDAENPETRIEHYTSFYSKLYEEFRPPITPDNAVQLSQLRVDNDNGIIVAEINSAHYVQKNTPDEQRGNVDMKVIGNLRKALLDIPEKQRIRSVRLAVLHHHPVLVPRLVEPGRGYDAVANSHHLLTLLRDFGFHLVLHGHKHYPHVFSYDTDSAWSGEQAPAMLVVGGGSAASRQLPSGQERCNSYNLVALKWHHAAGEARVRIMTRGLVTEDGGGEAAPDLWRWKTLRNIDRRLDQRHELPAPIAPSRRTPINAEAEAKRAEVYSATHRNMVVSEVLPSLVPGQAYEVRAWVVPNVDRDGRAKSGWVAPERVCWSAGEYFPRKEIARQDDPRFCCAFNYWGSMLLQAEMFFTDGTRGFGYTYARIPDFDATGSLPLPPNVPALSEDEARNAIEKLASEREINIGPVMAAPLSAFGTASYRAYASDGKGVIYCHSTGTQAGRTFYVRRGIGWYYEHVLGGARSPLGLPISNEELVDHGNGAPTSFFEGGYIEWLDERRTVRAFARGARGRDLLGESVL